MNYFHNLLPDLLQFIVSAIANFASLVTGGIIIAALTLWAIFKKPLSKRTWAGFVVLFVLIAFFNGWREQKNNVDIANNLVTQKQSEIDALNKPILDGRIESVFGAPTPNGGTLLTLISGFTNRGAPSAIAIGDVTIIYKGRELPTQKVPPPKGASVDLYQGPTNNSPSIGLQPDDFLPKKCISNPVPRGGEVGGWMQVYAPEIAPDKAREVGSVIRLYYTDAYDNKFHIEYYMNGRPGVFPPNAKDLGGQLIK
jgi:hypothetical protein